MLTNRKLFSIIIMIAVLFLLFQGSQAVRESLNHYEVNNFREETGLSASDVPDPESFAAEHRVLFIGDDESNEGKTVQEWASDVRYSFASVSAVNEALSYYSESAPALICIEGRCLTEADIPSLQELVNSGARLFFTSLPDAAFIENNEDIMKLLGIREVRAEETEITGTRLYSGFLLGGERVYEAETPEEEKRYLPLVLALESELPKADCYHCVATGYSGVLGSMAAHIYGGGLLLSEHGIYTREREEELIKAKWVQNTYKDVWIDQFRKMSQLVYDRADVVTSLFSHARELQIELGCPPEKAVITPNGVDVERFCNIPGKRKEDENYINIGAVLRVTPIKDVKTMIQAFAFAKEQVPSIKLWIMGPRTRTKPTQENATPWCSPSIFRTLNLQAG